MGAIAMAPRLKRPRRRLAEFAGRFEIRQGNFAELARVGAGEAVATGCCWIWV